MIINRHRRSTPAFPQVRRYFVENFFIATGTPTSKAALEALTRSTALDLAARGIRVNAVAPGPVQTGWIGEDLIAQATAIVPMGRVGEPDDIADAVVYLASHQARWITGQVLQVAGGHAL
ncbi:SDR family NAD(P)-dependent oxidoreductase [Nonomuraea cypriaca]|uniref:SDR family NAD(P)-dependent oxidoreductase n=1 Tax=Nonomuraea cypriaca TaxID=1187855 RepID=UPI002E2C2EC0|nr:SDR family oxidoreductase [Nonomuraea cypriaca]